jgi:ABC-type dipeptide/oligopeptide/nickel transport system permease component
MARHIAHRLMISLPVLLGVLLIGFLLLQVVPTNPAAVVAGPTATTADVAHLSSCSSPPLGEHES